MNKTVYTDEDLIKTLHTILAEEVDGFGPDIRAYCKMMIGKLSVLTEPIVKTVSRKDLMKIRRLAGAVKKASKKNPACDHPDKNVYLSNSGRRCVLCGKKVKPKWTSQEE